MNRVNEDILLFMLVALVSFSALDIDRHQAVVLFLCIAGLLLLVTKQPKKVLSPVVFIIIAYLIAFPMQIILLEIYPTLLSSVRVDAQNYGMLWATRGFGAFALGYALFEWFLKGINKRDWQNESICRTNIRYTIYVLTSIGWLAILSWIASVMIFGFSLVFIEGENSAAVDSAAGTFVQVLTLLSNLRYPFFLGFLALSYWNKSGRQLNLIFSALLLICLIDIITVGSKGAVIRLVLVTFLVLTVVPFKVNFKNFSVWLLAIIAVYGSFTVISEYRSIMHSEYMAGKDVFSFTVQSDAFLAALGNSLSLRQMSEDEQAELNQAVVSRFGSGMFSFSNLMDFTGRQPPYENALKSFMVPIYSITPRSLFPEKPEFFDSGRNAQENYGWSYGGMDVTLPGSFYYAWGYAGIIFGMLFLGALLAYIALQIRLRSIYSPHWLILMVVLILPMMDVGVTFQVIITSFIRVALVLLLVRLSYRIMQGTIRRRMSKIGARNKIETYT